MEWKVLDSIHWTAINHDNRTLVAASFCHKMQNKELSKIFGLVEYKVLIKSQAIFQKAPLNEVQILAIYVYFSRRSESNAM